MATPNSMISSCPNTNTARPVCKGSLDTSHRNPRWNFSYTPTAAARSTKQTMMIRASASDQGGLSLST